MEVLVIHHPLLRIPNPLLPIPSPLCLPQDSESPTSPSDSRLTKRMLDSEDSPPSSSSEDGSSSNSPPSPPNSQSSPPNSKSSPPSSDSESATSPPNSQSSPPSSDSESPPSPPNSQSSSSSSNSNSSPPSSGSKSPPPPPDTGSSALPTPPSPSSNSPSKSSPPPDDDDSSSPPPPSSSNSSPSNGDSSSSSPQPKSSPLPKSPSPSKESPPSQPTTSSPPSNSSSAVRSPPSPSQPKQSSPRQGIAPPLPQGSSPSAHSYHDPPSKEVNSSSPKGRGEGNLGAGAAVGLAFAGVLLVLVAICCVIRRKRRKRMDGLINSYALPNNYSGKADGYYYSQANPVPMGVSGRSNAYYAPRMSTSQSVHGHHSGPHDPTGSRSWFTYEELMDITNGFSPENMIGEGGFGSVYKGLLPDGRCVAVKQLKAGSGQGEREFQAEVEIISRVHHRHLVSLVGYCMAEYQRLLVYEFVPNGTLEHHLHGKGIPVMDWPNRLRIAIGSARGLAYLHEDCHPRIIHRDIKSANILLDNFFEAQVADFGLAKLSTDTHTHVSTRVMGTFGYLAPEYASSGKLTDRSDVYSFGVMLLELITGRRPVDASQPLGDESLVEWARPLLVHALETGDCEGLVDVRLENNYVKSEMFRMIEAAAACVRHSAPKRPRMVQVLRALDCDGDSADLSNGIKFGQSQVIESGNFTSDIQRHRRIAFGSGVYSSEYDQFEDYDRRTQAFSGQHHSREAPHRPML